MILSIILTKHLGMTGIILGSVIGNALGIFVCCWHFFRKSNTLRFVWHLSFKDFLLTSRYSIVDSSVYICWGLMDYVMISHVSGRYGENGLITLAVVVSLIEFGVVMDGVGMAMQPLIGTYFGEKNSKLIKRVMKSGIKAAIIEGAVATLLIMIFAKQFCALFGITGGEALPPSIAAIRIVSLGFVFCSTVSLTTSDRPYRNGNRVRMFPKRFIIYHFADIGLSAFRFLRYVGRVCPCADSGFKCGDVLCIPEIRKG